jgi:hypothetical protein
VDVAQPADLSVDQILALTGAIEPPRDLDLARDRSNQLLGGRERVRRQDLWDPARAGFICLRADVWIGCGLAVVIGRGLAKASYWWISHHLLDDAAESQPHLGGGGRLARVAAAEDHVLHLVAAQALGALLAHHPGDGVGHVALAAAVRADDRRHPFVEGQLRAVRKRFEAVDFQTFETHGYTTARHAAPLHETMNARSPRGELAFLAGGQNGNGPIGEPFLPFDSKGGPGARKTVVSVTRPSYRGKRKQ